MTTFLESQPELSKKIKIKIILKKTTTTNKQNYSVGSPPLQHAFHKYRCGKSKQDKDTEAPAPSSKAQEPCVAVALLHKIKWTSLYIQSCVAQPHAADTRHFP